MYVKKGKESMAGRMSRPFTFSLSLLILLQKLTNEFFYAAFFVYTTNRRTPAFFSKPSWCCRGAAVEREIEKKGDRETEIET